jgi:hypothetical protein
MRTCPCWWPPRRNTPRSSGWKLFVCRDLSPCVLVLSSQSRMIASETSLKRTSGRDQPSHPILKSLRENQALHIQPRRGDLNVAQDAVLGCIQEEISSPGGTAESILARFSRSLPGIACRTWWLRQTSCAIPTERRTCGFTQHSVAGNPGLELQSLVLTQTLEAPMIGLLFCRI